MSLGLVGIKTGMTRVFDESGTSIPVTVINIESNRISQIKTKERDGYSAIQIAYGSQKESRLNKAQLGHYKKTNLSPAKGQHEFRVNNISDDMTVGTDIKADRFKAGEHVDIVGKSLGKGFQGGVKRHNFKMQDATHGNSVSHRALGSTGQCQDPGRVFKGKKMPGQLGNVQRTIQNLIIVKIMPEENVILVKGSVPGHKGSTVIIKPTQKKYTPREIYNEVITSEASTKLKDKVTTESKDKPSPDLKIEDQVEEKATTDKEDK